MKYNIIQQLKNIPGKNLKGLLAGSAVGSGLAMYNNFKNDEDILQGNVLLGAMLGGGAGLSTSMLYKKRANFTRGELKIPTIRKRK